MKKIVVILLVLLALGVTMARAWAGPPIQLRGVWHSPQ